jgi:signal transduction histidine kinase
LYQEGRIILPVLIIASLLWETNYGNRKFEKRQVFLLTSVALLIGAGGATVNFIYRASSVPLSVGWIARPADFGSGLLFLISFFLILRRLLAKHDVFSGMLLASILCNVLGQLHLAFSRHLFDSLFDLAHGANIVGNIMPVLGISFQELAEIRRSRREIEARTRAEEALKEAQAHLEEKVEARTRELKEAQSKLVMQARMASVGQLAAGIAHEINNPLNFVSINFGTLKNDIEIFRDMVIAYRDLLNRLPGVTDVKGEIEKIRRREQEGQLDFVLEHIDRLFAESRDGMRRVIEIVNSMRDFSRTDSLGRFSPLNINKAVRDALVIAKNSYKYRAEIHEHLGEVPEITCVPDMINRVLLNLIVNAAQAIEEKAPGETLGRITVSTCADSDNVYCEVTDTGPGIPAEIQEKIFEPFFTTKGPGKGTGLGLSISYDIIVNKHGGELSVTSKVGEGAKFLICLPIRQDRRAKAHRDAAPITKEGLT